MNVHLPTSHHIIFAVNNATAEHAGEKATMYTSAFRMRMWKGGRLGSVREFSEAERRVISHGSVGAVFRPIHLGCQ